MIHGSVQVGESGWSYLCLSGRAWQGCFVLTGASVGRFSRTPRCRRGFATNRGRTWEWASDSDPASRGPYAATRAPQASQNRLSGESDEPQRGHAAGAASRNPQEEQNTASGSGRGPQVGHSGTGDVEAPAKRRLRTRPAIIASTSSPEGLAASVRSASTAAAVYRALSCS